MLQGSRLQPLQLRFFSKGHQRLPSWPNPVNKIKSKVRKRSLASKLGLITGNTITVTGLEIERPLKWGVICCSSSNRSRNTLRLRNGSEKFFKYLVFVDEVGGAWASVRPSSQRRWQGRTGVTTCWLMWQGSRLQPFQLWFFSMGHQRFAKLTQSCKNNQEQGH